MSNKGIGYVIILALLKLFSKLKIIFELMLSSVPPFQIICAVLMQMQHILRGWKVNNKDFD